MSSSLATKPQDVGATSEISVNGVLGRLATEEITSIELLEALFRDIERFRNHNIFITETKELALRQAEASDKRRAEGNLKPLDGVPIAVKDNFCTLGIKTTAGSKMLEDFVPTYESTVTQKLWDAGAVLVGKTNLDEFAMGSSTENSYFGQTLNPVGKALGIENLAPGGSSGGSAAAVAAGLAPGALGTDTGGSIRQPASFCGVIGFKPTYGVCSRWGIAAYASSLDQAGVFSKTVQDAAILMDVIAGEDKKDTTSLDTAFSFERSALTPSEKIKVGLPKEVIEFGSTFDANRVWQKAQELAKKLNANIIEVSLPSFKHALPAYYICALSEASSNLARYDGVRYGYRATGATNIEDMYERTRGEGFGEEVKRRIILGTFSLSSGYYDAYYLRALKVRQLVKNEFESAFQQADVIFMPTSPSGAFEFGSHKSDPVEMYLEDMFTVPINLAGLPSISIPVSQDKRGMPLGMQIIGPQLGDEKVLSIAAMCESLIRASQT